MYFKSWNLNEVQLGDMNESPDSVLSSQQLLVPTALNPTILLCFV